MQAGRRWYLGLLALVAAAGQAVGEVRLPHVFGSHMVLQRDRAVPIWGWDNPGQAIVVQVDGQAEVRGEAGADGRWQIQLPARPAGGPVTITVTGSSAVTFEDVLFGEVWLCSGQSNMEWPVAASANAAAEIAASANPRIRHLQIPKQPASQPVDDRDAAWQVAGPGTVAGWTAVGYFMARQLERELNVPVGLINASWGGTLIEPWITPAGLAGVPSLASIAQRVTLANPTSEAYQARLGQYLTELEAWLLGARESLEAGRELAPSPPYPAELRPLATLDSPMQQPTTLYCGMINPVAPYGLRGAIWYQGESNHREGMLYADKMQALVSGWRERWGQGEFPFYFVQIAPYHYDNEPPTYLPEFWEAQAAAAERIPNAGMAVIHDVGNANDIHPSNKQEVGRRLALLALKRTYGRAELEDSGPLFERLTLEGDALRLSFSHADGLRARGGGELTWFEICGPDTDWTPATARLDGTTIVLSSPQVKGPVAMRFAWHRNAEPNLENGAGLPAGAFRAGEVPKRDWLALKVPQAREYELVYDLDLAKLGPAPAYEVDRRAAITRPFDRVAYFLELQRDREPAQWVFAAMDAFTDDLGKIAIPTVASGALWQRAVTGLEVLTNVEGVATGTGLTGNLEFWPHNYGGPNGAGVANASGALWDFGDQYSDPVDGYGSMQIGNPAASQTIFAINHWNAGGAADLGIGNSTGQTRDWTFAGNAGQFAVKRLRVLVRLRNP